MGVATEYYLKNGLEKAGNLGREVNEAWKESSVKEYIEALQHFSFQEGEQVEVEDDTYEITERNVVQTFVTGDEFYTASKLVENPDGQLRKSYQTETIKGDQIK